MKWWCPPPTSGPKTPECEVASPKPTFACFIDDGLVHFLVGAADAKLVQGLMGVLSIAIEGLTPAQAALIPVDFAQEMGLDQHLDAEPFQRFSKHVRQGDERDSYRCGVKQMTTKEAVMDKLDDVEDPELELSIVELVWCTMSDSRRRTRASMPRST